MRNAVCLFGALIALFIPLSAGALELIINA